MNAEIARCEEYSQMARDLIANQKSTGALYLNQNMDKLKSFYKKEKCMQDLFKTVDECMEKFKVEDKCHSTSLRAIKVLRLKMMNMELFVKSIPDMQVVVYTRDPRATTASRQGYRSSTSDRWRQDVIDLCAEMKYDLEAMDYLEKIYPGVFLLVRYEDLVEDTDAIVTKLFDHAKTPLREENLQFMEEMVRNQEGVKTEGSDPLGKWRTVYDVSDVDFVTEHPECKTLLQRLDYT